MPALGFLGSADVSAVVLGALLEAGHDVRLAVTEPDRRRERRGGPSPTATKSVALASGVPVTERVGDLLDAGCDLGIVVAFGRLVRPPVLGSMPFVNLHFSLLPRWRGAAPVERAILAGDEVTGVSLMRLDQGLDTGPIHDSVPVPIGPHETAASLRIRLAEIGSRLLLDRLGRGPDGLGEPSPQRGEATYAAKIAPEERHIDWSATAETVERTVRIGRAWTSWRGRRLIVWDGRALTAQRPVGVPGELRDGRVATGEGWFELLEVQPAGRARQTAQAWWNGARPGEHERLGTPEAQPDAG